MVEISLEVYELVRLVVHLADASTLNMSVDSGLPVMRKKNISVYGETKRHAHDHDHPHNLSQLLG